MMNRLKKDPAPFQTEKWEGWQLRTPLGYDSNFLTRALPLNVILGQRTQDAAPLKDGLGIELKYLHFSSIIDKKRKFPILTAVNIDGNHLKFLGAREGRFRVDNRLDPEFQPAAKFYEKALGRDPVTFSRGHLVRRFDPCWGDDTETAEIADSHTFHYTNAAPQVQKLNGGKWLNVEDYILSKAQGKERRMTVFTGPIFPESDPSYGKDREGGPWQIPVSYWKVIAVQKSDAIVAATAFVLGQVDLLAPLYEALVFSNLRKRTLQELQSDNVQTTVVEIERLTNLDFGLLRALDVANALESTRQTRRLGSVSDIII